jgi:hypothetical protein
MKIVTIIIRTVLGLLFLYTSVSYFLYLSPNLHQQAIQSFPGWFNGSTYLFPLAKVLNFYVVYHL